MCLALGLGAIGAVASPIAPATPAAPAAAPAALDVDSTLLCTFDTGLLPELSGLALSQIHPDVVWATNDSLNGAYLYALSTTDCSIRATLSLLDTPARDHEALATGVDAQGRAVIWIGDIGNNDDEWPYVRIQKVIEPEDLADADVSVTTYRFTYPEGPANAEALIAAPDREQLWVVTKRGGDGGAIYQLPTPLDPSTEPMIATRLGPARAFITDGAMSPDGTHYVTRDYLSAEVFAGEPTGVPQARFRLPFQVGGESVTWTADGHHLLVGAEGSGKLIRVSVPRVALGADSGLASLLPRVAGFDVYPYVRLAAAAIGLLVLLAWATRRARQRRRSAAPRVAAGGRQR